MLHDDNLYHCLNLELQEAGAADTVQRCCSEKDSVELILQELQDAETRTVQSRPEPDEDKDR